MNFRKQNPKAVVYDAQRFFASFTAPQKNICRLFEK